MPPVTTAKTFYCRDDFGKGVEIRLSYVHKRASCALRVKIETERLCIQSVESKDRDEYIALFSSPKVMEKFANGKPKTRREISIRLREWMKRWDRGYPYSALAVSKRETHEFIGHVIAGEGDRPGQSELAFLFKETTWNQGYGTEVVRAIKKYVQVLSNEGFLVENKPVDEMTATARQTNKYSRKILKGIGMHVVRAEERVVDETTYRVYHHRMPISRA